jgi:hypothetical protein
MNKGKGQMALAFFITIQITEKTLLTERQKKYAIGDGVFNR